MMRLVTSHRAAHARTVARGCEYTRVVLIIGPRQAGNDAAPTIARRARRMAACLLDRRTASVTIPRWVHHVRAAFLDEVQARRGLLILNIKTATDRPPAQTVLPVGVDPIPDGADAVELTTDRRPTSGRCLSLNDRVSGRDHSNCSPEPCAPGHGARPGSRDMRFAAGLRGWLSGSCAPGGSRRWWFSDHSRTATQRRRERADRADGSPAAVHALPGRYHRRSERGSGAGHRGRDDPLDLALFETVYLVHRRGI